MAKVIKTMIDRDDAVMPPDRSPELVVCEGSDMDGDLEKLSRAQLMNEGRRLRAGIREHRDSTGHELCWHHPAVIAAARAIEPASCRSRSAAIPPRLHHIPPITRRAGS